MRLDLSAALRRRKPDRRRSQLTPRNRGELIGPADVPPGRLALVADTNVYINMAAGRVGDDVEALLDRSLLFHCSVCLGELATGIGNADPGHPRWRATRDHYAELFASIPATRLLTPDPDTWIEAGLIAGTLARTQRFQPAQRKELVNDALIFLTAAKTGFPVLTSNRDEFDLIQQLAPEGHFVCYATPLPSA